MSFFPASNIVRLCYLTIEQPYRCHTVPCPLAIDHIWFGPALFESNQLCLPDVLSRFNSRLKDFPKDWFDLTHESKLKNTTLNSRLKTAFMDIVQVRLKQKHKILNRPMVFNYWIIHRLIIFRQSFRFTITQTSSPTLIPFYRLFISLKFLYFYAVQASSSFPRKWIHSANDSTLEQTTGADSIQLMTHPAYENRNSNQATNRLGIIPNCLKRSHISLRLFLSL